MLKSLMSFHLFFDSGSTIYGRVMVDPVQNLGDSFSCSIEKVFLCTGTDGYVPKYNPTNKEYGCLADAPSLLYRFKILVRFIQSTKDNTVGLRHPEAKRHRSLFWFMCVLFYRTRPSQRLKLQHLVVLLLRPHWLKTQLELCLWSDNQDQMVLHCLPLHSSRSWSLSDYTVFIIETHEHRKNWLKSSSLLSS